MLSNITIKTEITNLITELRVTSESVMTTKQALYHEYPFDTVDKWFAEFAETYDPVEFMPVSYAQMQWEFIEKKIDSFHKDNYQAAEDMLRRWHQSDINVFELETELLQLAYNTVSDDNHLHARTYIQSLFSEYHQDVDNQNGTYMLSLDSSGSVLQWFAGPDE